ncbi:DUF2993 domain-containing protein [Streptomyces carminius]|uniref:DUF2993 domain-containing protein n=1 Tax=Streptomyces carminius TaxID=2665496 RepID=A0A2M8LZV1_9ACTN|nr:DUF2993 domain-containing protein [Streptomyces carminius]PJE97482.1 DUF2993 domain-containing protein [Streptomyces carminius]
MRALRVLLILTVLLGGLFVGADRLAVGLAEDKIAERIRSSRGLDQNPSVQINGFPFLTQVAGKELDSVDASMDGLTVRVGDRSVEVTEVDVKLRDVRLENNFSSAVAGRATGTARIGYADLTAAGTEGVTAAYAGPERAAENQVRIDVDIPVAQVTLYSAASVRDGDTIALRAENIPEIPVAENLIRGRVDHELKITGLPEGLRLEKLTMAEDGVTLHLSGSEVDLAG